MFNKKKKAQQNMLNQKNEEQAMAQAVETETVVQKKPAAGRQMTASWKLLNNNGPVPIAPPADFIQLTPIVQPVPLVPYSTQLQPILTFDEDEDI